MKGESMLVLSRKKGQRIRIGESLVLAVLELTNGRVRLGFEAPVGVTILREEVRNEFREGTSRGPRLKRKPRIKT